MTVSEWFEDAALLEKFTNPYDGPPIDMCWSRSERAFRYRLKRSLRILEERYGYVPSGPFRVRYNHDDIISVVSSEQIMMTFQAIEVKR